MSTQPPRGRQGRNGNSRGGRALMLLGIILALLAGVLVIYIVSNATQTAGQTEPVVVVTKPITVGQTFNVSVIQANFTVKNYPVSDVPAGAYIFTTQDALNVMLSTQAATQELYPGDVLLVNDQRISSAKDIVTGSISSEGTIPTGDVLFPLNYSNLSNGGQNFVVAGDHIDIIVTECNAPWYANGCETQTTFQNLVVYATFPSALIVAMTPDYASELKLLAQTGNMTIAVRGPADTTKEATPQPADPATVASTFGFK